MTDQQGRIFLLELHTLDVDIHTLSGARRYMRPPRGCCGDQSSNRDKESYILLPTANTSFVSPLTPHTIH